MRRSIHVGGIAGGVRQDDTPATMRYPIEYQIHYRSTFTTLRLAAGQELDYFPNITFRGPTRLHVEWGQENAG